MTRGVRKYLVSSAGFVALTAIAGCTHYLLAQRQPWRHDAELACLNAGVPQELPGRVRIATIEGPGACGIDYPLKVSEIGENSTPLGYGDEALRPPSSIPAGAMPQQWPLVQSNALPPLQQPAASPSEPYNAPYGSPRYYDRPPPYGSAQQSGGPMPLTPGGPSAAAQPYPYGGAPDQAGAPPALYSSRPLGQSRQPLTGPAGASAGPVELAPAATLACPIVSMLDKWVSMGVQPAALKWFREPVVEIKQIGSYSCRGMNGDPNAHISEHAFGNALDIAEFDLADGHRISVEHGWHGSPQEQGFLHDVQDAACRDFMTVLAPGANIYHYNHIHVDLMRRSSRRHICEPAAIPGEIAAARARARYAAPRYPGVTGSINAKPYGDETSYSRDHGGGRPVAVPGED
jgi:Extensin-like protein C-terminus